MRASSCPRLIGGNRELPPAGLAGGSWGKRSFPPREAAGGERSPGQVLHQPPELLAALLEIAVLVVAGGGGRQQHHVSRSGGDPGERRREVAVPLRVRDRGRELAGRLTDQVDASDVRSERRREGREVLALARPAED